MAEKNAVNNAGLRILSVLAATTSWPSELLNDSQASQSSSIKRDCLTLNDPRNESDRPEPLKNQIHEGSFPLSTAYRKDKEFFCGGLEALRNKYFEAKAKPYSESEIYSDYSNRSPSLDCNPQPENFFATPPIEEHYPYPSQLTINIGPAPSMCCSGNIPQLNQTPPSFNLPPQAMSTPVRPGVYPIRPFSSPSSRTPDCSAYQTAASSLGSSYKTASSGLGSQYQTASSSLGSQYQTAASSLGSSYRSAQTRCQQISPDLSMEQSVPLRRAPCQTPAFAPGANSTFTAFPGTNTSVSEASSYLTAEASKSGANSEILNKILEFTDDLAKKETCKITEQLKIYQRNRRQCVSAD